MTNYRERKDVAKPKAAPVGMALPVGPEGRRRLKTIDATSQAAMGIDYDSDYYRSLLGPECRAELAKRKML